MVQLIAHFSIAQVQAPQIEHIGQQSSETAHQQVCRLGKQAVTAARDTSIWHIMFQAVAANAWTVA